MYDMNALHRAARHTLGGGKRMILVIWSESCPFIVLGLQHMVFDMETREIYFDHFKKLYETLEHKVILCVLMLWVLHAVIADHKKRNPRPCIRLSLWTGHLSKLLPC